MDAPVNPPDVDHDEDWILLTDPDVSGRELERVIRALRSSRLSAGPLVEDFEAEFAAHHGRAYGVATASGTIGMWLALRALGIGPGDEVVACSYGWHQTAHAILLAGATPNFAEIDYWSGCISPSAAADRIGPKTKAIIGNNCNGHPAAWKALRQLAESRGVALLEDSTEAIGSRYLSKPVGSFGDLSVFDFSQPGALCCGEGGMVLTDDPHLATELRYLRAHRLSDRTSVSIGSRVPLQGGMSDLTAALGLAQLERIDEILARRKQVEAFYRDEMQSFEGIKPPYLGPDVDEVHWMLYVVHLGARFSASSRAQIVDDLEADLIEAAPFSALMHQQFAYQALGEAYNCKRGCLKNTERIGDRSLALPFYGQLGADEVKFLVKTLKDACTNVGAGAAIYL
jgi:perosamine synthetase